VLLLADATGHGIGPALSVLQLRAMLRMAIHIHPDIPLIARHMNEQLCADLPAGRFITTWLGQISAADHELTHLSAGQAPLLHYTAADGHVEVLAAHTMPMGLFEEIETDAAVSVALKAGDIFAVISDGIFESTNGDNEQYGTDRVGAIIKHEASRPATDIVAAIRTALDDFTQAAPADDDRTILIIKRL
jgi:phosphoserine phosphatase